MARATGRALGASVVIIDSSSSILAVACASPDDVRAVLSDDHSYERGLAALHDLIDQVVRDEGATVLGDLTVAVSLELAKALEEIAQEQGLAAVDLAEVWFVG